MENLKQLEEIIDEFPDIGNDEQQYQTLVYKKTEKHSILTPDFLASNLCAYQNHVPGFLKNLADWSKKFIASTKQKNTVFAKNIISLNHAVEFFKNLIDEPSFSNVEFFQHCYYLATLLQTDDGLSQEFDIQEMIVDEVPGYKIRRSADYIKNFISRHTKINLDGIDIEEYIQTFQYITPTEFPVAVVITSQQQGAITYCKLWLSVRFNVSQSDFLPTISLNSSKFIRASKKGIQEIKYEDKQIGIAISQAVKKAEEYYNEHIGNDKNKIITHAFFQVGKLDQDYDGASIGAPTFFSTLCALSGVPIPEGVVCTGQIGHDKRHLQVSGINPKAIAVHRANKHLFLIPHYNLKDIDLPEEFPYRLEQSLSIDSQYTQPSSELTIIPYQGIQGLFKFWNINFNESQFEPSSFGLNNFKMLYCQRLTEYYKEWSQKYTNLKLTTDIRVATYKGKRIKKKGGEWWFRDALENRKINRVTQEKIVILGDPGAGKTTACQRIAWELAKESQERNQALSRIPIVIALKDYMPTADKKGVQGILECIVKTIEEIFISKKNIVLSREELADFIRQHPFVFFFDGLNEVGSNLRKNIIEDIKSFIDAFQGKRNQFIVTTRKFDFEYEFSPAFLSEQDQFHILEILELDNSGIHEFVMRVFGEVNELRSFHSLLMPDQSKYLGILCDNLIKNTLSISYDEIILELDQLFDGIEKKSNHSDYDCKKQLSKIKKAFELLEKLQLQEYKRILWLSQNPSILEDVILVYSNFELIPQSRAMLFEHAIKARIDIQDKKRGTTSRFDNDDKYHALQKIAFAMVGPEKGLKIQRKLCNKLFKEVLDAGKNSGRQQELLYELYAEDYLLVESAKDNFSFIKQPYQEFFCARELYGQWKLLIETGKKPLKDSSLHKFFYDRFYFQITSIMAGFLTPDELEVLFKLLRKKKKTQRLAALCLRHSAGTLSDRKIVKKFIQATRKRIMKFTYLPEEINNYLTSLLVGGILFYFLTQQPQHLLIEWVNSFQSFLIKILPKEWGKWTGIALIGIVSIFSRLSIHRFSPSNKPNKKIYGNSLLMIVFLSALIMAFEWPLSFATAGMIGISGCFLLFMLAFDTTLKKFTQLSAVQIEEYFVNWHLIHNLEVLRLLDENRTVIPEIQTLIKNDTYISERIKDAIERTWVSTPYAGLKILKNIDQPEVQMEAVVVLCNVMKSEISRPSDRESAASGVLKVIKQKKNIAAAMRGIEEFAILTTDFPEYKNNFYQILKEDVQNKSQPLEYRRRAHKICERHGLNLAYPKATFKEIIKNYWIIFVGIAVILSFLLLVFL